ncbi:MAG TPA: helix-turn-helix domain-containing protein [Candidatus Dormibacteraeota bacterium]
MAGTTEVAESVGERIRRLRRERGMSLAQVVGEDFSRAFLNQVEHGKAQPSTRILRVIAHRLGTRVEYLLEGSDAREQLELEVEKARVEVLLGNYQAALDLLGPSLESHEWPVGSDARVTRAEALIGLGQRAEGLAILAAEEPAIKRNADRSRIRRLQAVRRGRVYRPNNDDLVLLGMWAEREGRIGLALEHYRAARILLTGPARRNRLAAGQSAEA